MLDFETTLTDVAESGSDLRALLTPKQLQVENDLSFTRIVCGARQWGKSTWTAAAHVLAAIPGATSLAIAPTVTKARDLLWHGCEWLNAECDAGLVLMRGDFQILVPNGGVIQLMGMSTEREADKIRGYTPPFVTVEECGTYKPDLLRFAVESCITPSQIKWFRRGGRGKALIGTPGIRVKDYWHQLCQGELGGGVHFATVHDNPHIPDPEAYLEWVLTEYKWTRATPRFRREYLGQFCAEQDSMCYPAAEKLELLPQAMAPASGYTLMGIDLGATRSPSAWVVVRVTKELVDGVQQWILHFLHSSSVMTPTVHDVADVTFKRRKDFGVQRMRGDSAGLGAMTLETLRSKFKGLPVESAEKPGNKISRIWLLDSMLQSGTCRFYEGARTLLEQMANIPYNDAKDDHHDSYPDHEPDAAHYVVELVQQWTQEQEPKKAAYGSPAWEREQMDRYREQALRRGMGSDEN